MVPQISLKGGARHKRHHEPSREKDTEVELLQIPATSEPYFCAVLPRRYEFNRRVNIDSRGLNKNKKDYYCLIMRSVLRVSVSRE